MSLCINNGPLQAQIIPSKINIPCKEGVANLALATGNFCLIVFGVQ